MSSMFCYQCEQAAQGTGCTSFGVCGKDPETAALQDLVVHAVKGLAMYAHRARQLGVSDQEINTNTVKALFATLTNVDFDPERFQQCLLQLAELKNKARGLYEQAVRSSGGEPERLTGPAQWMPASDLAGLIAQGEAVSIEKRLNKQGDDITGLQELAVYGLKGAAAYVDHAQILGHQDDAVYARFHEVLDYLAGNPDRADELTATCLGVGELNYRAMQLLDSANTGTYGHPEPTAVRIEPKQGKAICVSGHDLKDLEALLRQTEGTGIQVYTHGEMLPCNAYPGLKKYDHLAGNYGGAWQDQREEFETFPGAILMTTNCLMKPKDTYKNRIFTSGLVGWPGVRHIEDGNFQPVIDAALAADGFSEDGADKTIMTGFGHDAVMQVAGTVVDAVKSGSIRHFFLIGGCDGAKPGRNYYTELAEAVPDDCVILTLACGKYRFNKMDFGDIGGVPRLLDVGQCNDAYSAIQIALALADAFDCGVNELPLSMILSWFEQKAVAILLTLLHLNVQRIKLGPSLPAFVSPNVLNVLVENFGIAPIGTPEEDLRQALGTA